MFLTFAQGFGTSGGLIAAIGAQNAFVLSQSIRNNRPALIAAICIICDAIFICMGVTGTGAAIAALPSLTRWIASGGAVFLFLYGWRSFKAAAGSKDGLESAGTKILSLRATILTTLAVTLLNPHFYLDTVILIGSVSSGIPQTERMWFLAGAVCASTAWFICLSLGGRIFAPTLSRPSAWRILEMIIGVIMWGIGFSLLAQIM